MMISNNKYLKQILHSRRANIFYLEHCRILVNDGRVEYLTPDKLSNHYWNIPIANTTCLLLGTGTSITNQAVRLLATAGVMLGFTGSGGTPLISGIEWFSPQNEYRSPEYLQQWCSFWFDEKKRLQAAKKFQLARISYFENLYPTRTDLPPEKMNSIISNTKLELSNCKNTNELLLVEARYVKGLYALFSNTYSVSFKKNINGNDRINKFMVSGNYLAYGLAACSLWVLGIPHSLALFHGKTRRGALVFDVADLIKDSIIMANSFIYGMDKSISENDFRGICINDFLKHKSLDYMFENIKSVCAEFGVKS